MLREFFLADSRATAAWAWLGLLCFVGHQAFRAYLKYAINEWYETFYDSLQGVPSSDGSEASVKEQRAQIYVELLQFCLIVLPAVVVHPVASYVRSRWCYSWRLALTQSYLQKWNTDAECVEGASQRVQEDAARFTSGVHTFVAMLLESCLTMAVFLPVLHNLDPQLLYVAVGTAVGGIGVSAFVGRHLVFLENANQRVEASFRKRLVLLESDPSLVLQTQSEVLPSFAGTLALLTDNYMRLYAHFAGLNLWLGSWDQAAVVLPYVLAAPRLYPLGDATPWTLGKVVQATNAFGKIFDSINVVSDSFMAINEWRSVLARLRGFEASQRKASDPPAAAAAVSTTELLPAGPISALACDDDDDGNDNSVRVGNDQHSDSEQA